MGCPIKEVISMASIVEEFAIDNVFFTGFGKHLKSLKAKFSTPKLLTIVVVVRLVAIGALKSK